MTLPAARLKKIDRSKALAVPGNHDVKLAKYLRGKKVLLVDDIFRSGRKLSELKKLVEANGGEVVGLAVIVYQPTPKSPSFGDLPLYYLAKLDGRYSDNAESCDLCKQGLPLDSVWI